MLYDAVCTMLGDGVADNTATCGTCQPSRCGDGFVDSEAFCGSEQCESDADCPDGGLCRPADFTDECTCI